MAALSTKLRSLGEQHIAFWCPGCRETHAIRIRGDQPGAKWSYNNNQLYPTFTPSILSTTGHYSPGRCDRDCWCTYYARFGHKPPFTCQKCHSFITDGKIRYLSDSTHHLSGQTVDLPDFPNYDQGIDDIY